MSLGRSNSAKLITTGLLIISCSLLTGVSGCSSKEAKSQNSNQTKNHSHKKINPTRMAKAKGPLTLKITKTSQDDIKPNEAFSLVATVTSSESLTNVDLKWVIPKTMTVVEGNLTDQLAAIQKGESQQVNLTLKTSESKNEKIFFIAAFKKGSSNLSATSQFNTKKVSFVPQKGNQLKKSSKDKKIIF